MNGRKVFEDKAASGLSAKEYCQQNGIGKDQYFYWQKIVRESVLNEIKPNRFTELPVPVSSDMFFSLTAPSPITKRKYAEIIKAVGEKKAVGTIAYEGNQKIAAIVVEIDVGSEYHYARAFDNRGVEYSKKAFKFGDTEEGFETFKALILSICKTK